MGKKGEKKARVSDVITREYTINMHKRLLGQYVPPQISFESFSTCGAGGKSSWLDVDVVHEHQHQHGGRRLVRLLLA